MKEKFFTTMTQTVAWGDMDAFQHVNNTVYFKYFENIRIEYFEKTGINRFMSQFNVGPILGTTECKYITPLTFPDNIILSTRVSTIRKKRFTMLYSIFSEKYQKVAAEGSGEIVYFDYAKGESCNIPEEIISNINHIEKDR